MALSVYEQSSFEAAMAKPFTMPKVEIGTPVSWWATGQRETGSPLCGIVARVLPNARMIEVQLVDGRTIFDARHADDPKLVNPDIREDGGCWDFSPFYRNLMDVLDLLKADIALLKEDAATKPSRK